jgi:thiol-disulfide isomerase/thioredoxin
MHRTHLAPAALAAALALTLTGCASDDAGEPAAAASTPTTAPAEPSVEPEPSAMDSEDAMGEDVAGAMAKEGAWIDRAAYEADPAGYHAAGDVVLFFNATWCPTCQAAVENLDTDGTPAGLTVVSVDYDDSTELKRTYGVTYQHTFVQVDEAGNELAKFTGSRTGEEIAANTV